MKLVEVLGTKYLSTNWLQDIRYLVKNLDIENPEEIHIYEKAFREELGNPKPYKLDLAGARVCKDVMTYICSTKCDNVWFVDTENDTRDKLLAENRRRSKLRYETTPLPELHELPKLPDYMASLDPTIVYNVDGMKEDEALRLVVLLIAHNPALKIDMGSKYEALFQFVDSMINLSTYKCEKVLYIVGSTFAEADVKDGKVYIPGYGDLDWDVFINTFDCVPYEFGTEVLWTNPVWRDVIVKCITSLPQYLKRRITITDYFKMEA